VVADEDAVDLRASSAALELEPVERGDVRVELLDAARDDASLPAAR